MKRLILFLAAISLFATTTPAEPGLEGLNRLDGVSVYSDEGEAKVVFRFEKKIKLKSKPTFYAKSIQIDFKGAYINPAKRNFKLNQNPLISATAYQYSPDTVRIRLFMLSDPRSFKDKWTNVLNGELMILTLQKNSSPVLKPKKILSETLKKAPAQNGNNSLTAQAPPLSKPAKEKRKPASDSKSADNIKQIIKIASMSAKAGRKVKPATNNFIKYEEPTAPEPPSTTSMIIKMVASLSLVLSLVFALAWFAKNYLSKFNAIPGYSGSVNVLTTGSIDGKKRISIVDVAGELMILGVTEESITLLSSVSDDESIERIRRIVGSSASTPRNERGLSSKPAKASWTPDFVKSALNILRIGKSKASTDSIRALFDESASDTFAGHMAQAKGDSSRSGAIETGSQRATDERAAAHRGDIMRQVTRTIKKRNGRLRIA